MNIDTIRETLEAKFHDSNGMADQLRAAILGAESEKDCLSCGRQGPNDCPQDGKA